METNMTRNLLMAALMCVAVPAIAQPNPSDPPKSVPSGPACLRPINLYDFKPVPGNRSLIVIDQARQRYRVNFMSVCYNLQYHLGVAFKTRGTGQLSCVAKGDSVLIRDEVTPGPCIIKDVEYQTVALDQADAQAAAAAKEKH
jgi:hypothetical protein